LGGARVKTDGRVNADCLMANHFHRGCDRRRGSPECLDRRLMVWLPDATRLGFTEGKGIVHERAQRAQKGPGWQGYAALSGLGCGFAWALPWAMPSGIIAVPLGLALPGRSGGRFCPEWAGRCGLLHFHGQRRPAPGARSAAFFKDLQVAHGE
jgi:hypothetical protein